MSRSAPWRSTLAIWTMLLVILSDGSVQSGISKWPTQAEELTWEQLQSRLNQVGVDQLIEELEQAEAAHRYQTLIGCLRLADDVLRDSPHELGFQIEVRCRGTNDPVVGNCRFAIREIGCQACIPQNGGI